MVVVSVRYPDRRTLRRVFAETFTIGTGDADLILDAPGAASGVVEIVVSGPDARIGRDSMQTSVRLNGEHVDPDFVHVLHVGDELQVLGHVAMFELVEGTPDDVRRFTGETSRALVPAELDLLAALREDSADAVAHEVYADWLDEQGRSGEAEFVRLQWLPRGRAELDPEAFSSEWMSHDPRAVQLRLRDLSPLMEPARRALVSRPYIQCRRSGCSADWVRLSLDADSDLVRWCEKCHVAVEFCSTFDEIQARGRQRLPVALDPGLVLERALQAFSEPNRDFDEPTNPRIVIVDEDD